MMTTEPETPGPPDESIWADFEERIDRFKPGTLILIPQRIGDDGRAQYRDSQITMPKSLRRLGVPAEFLHRPEERVSLSEFSADTEAVLTYVLGVSQNMTWDVAKLAVQYFWSQARELVSGDAEPRVRFTVGRVTRKDGTILEGLDISGPTNDDTAERLLRVLCGDDHDRPSQC